MALVSLCAPGVASADAYSVRLEPGYSASKSTTTAEGVSTQADATAILQKYGLTIDETLWPMLRIGAGGLLDWTHATTTSPTLEADTDAKRWLGYARLDFGGPSAGGGVGYDRREDVNRFEPRDGGSATATTTRNINEIVSVYGVLTPDGLPSADLRLSRTTTHDAERTTTDLEQNQLSLNLRYIPIAQLDLRYSLRASDANDRIKGVETTQLSNLVRAAYQDLLLDRRLAMYASYDVTRLDSYTTVSGVGGTVTDQQFPIRGLSALETLPTPERIALDQNPALIDANLTASAGIDIGYSHTIPSDDAAREMGVQFADAVTPVGLLYVWIDRQLPPDVVSAYRVAGRWTAYGSDDNLTWTPVSVLGVEPGQFANRFEISIAETRARYLKIVTTRLPVGVTFDPQVANVFVTELQAYRVQQAADVRGRHTATQGSFNGALRYDFEGLKGATYDLATSVRHGGQLARPAWFVVNALGYLRRLRPTLVFSTRLERSDSDDGRGHESGSRYAVSLGATPLPTLTATATLNGGYTQTVGGSELRNGILGSVTADLYRGVAVNASGSASYGRNNTGRTLLALESSATASLLPHRTFSLSATFAATDTKAEGGGVPSSEESLGRVEATASFTPFAALYLSGALSRFIWGRLAPDTLASFGVTASPLPGSPLLLRFNYQESLDTSQELKTRSAGPALRWTIRPRWYVEATYTYFESTTPTVETRSRVFFAHLFGLIGG